MKNLYKYLLKLFHFFNYFALTNAVNTKHVTGFSRIISCFSSVSITADWSFKHEATVATNGV